MTDVTRAKIPHYLHKYIVTQEYDRYTPEDQAVWRFIMRQLKSFLSKNAHASYVTGLEQTGIEIDNIPRLEKVDERLAKIGWGAIPVSGFIPPAAFMEFQSLGILPIATAMRTAEHVQYTPAPDIVHEAAGHAPILINPSYADYLKQYGGVARHAILSREDIEQYEAIRVLSDLKEHPQSSPAAIARAEATLLEVNRKMSHISEAALLSRMNWWTAEYGLIGDLKDPKIFGAGLLSSVGESRNSLSGKVKKLPLTVDCVNYGYDITEQQPQLFVCEDFAHLGDVLEQLADRMAFRRGGVFGLERAVEAATVNTVELNSGLQISGQLRNFLHEPQPLTPTFLKFSGHCQLAVEHQQLPGHDVTHHAQGFSSPLGTLTYHKRCLSLYTVAELENMGLRVGTRSRLNFENGFCVEGVLTGWTYHAGKLILISWKDCRVTRGSEVYFQPEWGTFDMAVGSKVTSVFAGAADRAAYGGSEDFTGQRVPPRKFSPSELARHQFFNKIRETRKSADKSGYQSLLKTYLSDATASWLEGIELLELSYSFGYPDIERAELIKRLKPENFKEPSTHESVTEGVRLARQIL